MRLFLTLMFMGALSAGRAQMTMDAAKAASLELHMSEYSYHAQFMGHTGYGASLILTADGGAAAFGTGDEGNMLLKWTKDAKIQWKRMIVAKGDEMELQSVVETSTGNYLV